MAALETPPNNTIHPIRVTAVAPGIVMTPLWTDHPEKYRMIDHEKDTWLLPEEVAERMLELVTKEEHVGGTVLEITPGRSRRVVIVNDPGPSGPGSVVSARTDVDKEVWGSISNGYGLI